MTALIVRIGMLKGINFNSGLIIYGTVDLWHILTAHTHNRLFGSVWGPISKES